MPWNDLANNQTISFTNLKDAVDNKIFRSKTTIPTGNEQITKSDADTYVYLNTGYSPFSSKSSNQLVVKSNLQSDSDNSITFVSDSTRTLQLYLTNNGIFINGDLGLFIVSEDCGSFTKNQAVLPITTSTVLVDITFGSAPTSETYDYYFYIYDNPTRSTLIYSNTGSVTLAASTSKTIELKPPAFTVGAGLYYQLIAVSTSCPM